MSEQPDYFGEVIKTYESLSNALLNTDADANKIMHIDNVRTMSMHDFIIEISKHKIRFYVEDKNEE